MGREGGGRVRVRVAPGRSAPACGGEFADSLMTAFTGDSPIKLHANSMAIPFHVDELNRALKAIVGGSSADARESGTLDFKEEGRDRKSVV